MYTVHLHNLKFHAFHGIHEEETIVGSEFEVFVDITSTVISITSIENAIDYSKVYELISLKMNTPVPLLEILAEDICHSIYESFNHVQQIKISIFKCSAPIISLKGKVGVSYIKNYL